MNKNNTLPVFRNDDVCTYKVGKLRTLFKRCTLEKNSNKKTTLVDQYIHNLGEALNEKSNRNRTFALSYPDLPICTRIDDLKKIISENPVTIVQGETGSGKTTQLPKICLELGLSDRGIIGCTQPRRIAALSIASRLREELEDKKLVGAKIRFLLDTPDEHRIRVMTDGILLQEYRNDPWLSQYSCMIIDEAHERSLNIDLLLGILKDIRTKRPDLKLIITSATIDTELFSHFFDKAPVVKVEGKAFPVQLIHHPIEDSSADNLHKHAFEAIMELQEDSPDNLLCFMPTERDIIELEGMFRKHREEFAILPLYSRLSHKEQQKVFQSNPLPKIILATNVAETSLTIPGIAYVVDSGLARISRFLTHSRVQGLPVEKISQASADQRKGRAGRVKPGVCVRLYAQNDYLDRPEWTDPEILRSNLSNVVLQLLDLKQNPEEFDFIQIPPGNTLRAAKQQLTELGALSVPVDNKVLSQTKENPQNKIQPSKGNNDLAKLTPLGRKMAKLPLDASLARILLASKDFSCLEEVIVIVAALSLAEVRINPQEGPDKERARLLHQVWRSPKSDLLTMLNMWNAMWNELGEKASQNKIRKYCINHLLNAQRMKEWIDLTDQYRQIFKLKKTQKDDPKTLKENSRVFDLQDFNHESFHQSFVQGFLSGLARFDEKEGVYRLAGGKEAIIFPASSLYRKNPEWIVGTRLRETSRTFLDACIEIDPLWIEKLFPHLIKKHYGEPLWNEKSGFVEAVEEIRFKHFKLNRSKRVQYERIDKEVAFRVFCTEGIVRNQLPERSRKAKNFKFLNHNKESIHYLKRSEQRLRCPGLTPSEDQLADWYAQKLLKLNQNSFISNYRDLEKLAYKAFTSKDESFEKTLSFDPEDWLSSEILSEWSIWLSEDQKNNFNLLNRLFPKRLSNGVRVEVRFDPGNSLDGIVLYAPTSFYEKVELGKIAIEIPGWRKWIWDSVVFSSSKSFRTTTAPLLEDIQIAWSEELYKNPFQSPLESLYNSLCPFAEEHGFNFSIPGSWDTETQLHILPPKSLTTELAPLHLTPNLGNSQLTQTISKYLYSENPWVKEYLNLKVKQIIYDAKTDQWLLPKHIGFSWMPSKESAEDALKMDSTSKKKAFSNASKFMAPSEGLIRIQKDRQDFMNQVSGRLDEAFRIANLWNSKSTKNQITESIFHTWCQNKNNLLTTDQLLNALPIPPKQKMKKKSHKTLSGFEALKTLKQEVPEISYYQRALASVTLYALSHDIATGLKWWNVFSTLNGEQLLLKLWESFSPDQLEKEKILKLIASSTPPLPGENFEESLKGIVSNTTQKSISEKIPKGKNWKKLREAYRARLSKLDTPPTQKVESLLEQMENILDVFAWKHLRFEVEVILEASEDIQRRKGYKQHIQGVAAAKSAPADKNQLNALLNKFGKM